MSDFGIAKLLLVEILDPRKRISDQKVDERNAGARAASESLWLSSRNEKERDLTPIIGKAGICVHV